MLMPSTLTKQEIVGRAAQPTQINKKQAKIVKYREVFCKKTLK
jgi:hypothetical protein